MLIADHFPKLARERPRDRESDPEPREPPPPGDTPPPAAPGPVASSVEPAPRALRPGCIPWIVIPGRSAETRGPPSPGRVTGPGRRNVGATPRGQLSRARPSGPVAHSPGRVPGAHSLDSAAGTGGPLRAGSREPAAGTGGPLSGLDPRVCPRGHRAGSPGLGPHPGVRGVTLAPRRKARSSEAGDPNCPPAGAERAPGPTLVPIWFPHWPAWMCTISLMAGASALGRWLCRRRRDCGPLRAPGT